MVPGLLVIVGQHVSPRHAKTCANATFSSLREVKALRKAALTASRYLLRSVFITKN